LSQYTRVTDGRTDGRTDRRTEFSSLDRVCISCSAVKTLKLDSFGYILLAECEVWAMRTHCENDTNMHVYTEWAKMDHFKSL